MKYTTVSARIDSEKALEAKAILRSKGISVSSAIRSMLIKIAETGDVPFKIQGTILYIALWLCPFQFFAIMVGVRVSSQIHSSLELCQCFILLLQRYFHLCYIAQRAISLFSYWSYLLSFDLAVSDDKLFFISE